MVWELSWVQKMVVLEKWEKIWIVYVGDKVTKMSAETGPRGADLGEKSKKSEMKKNEIKKTEWKK